MGIRLSTVATALSLAALLCPSVQAGKYGFSDKEGGSKNDPVIKVSASIAPDSGAIFSLDETTANELYTFDTATGFFKLSSAMPLIPQNASGGNQFLSLKFPMSITSKKITKSLVKKSGVLAGNSFLTSNLSITDETNAHVPGVAFINGKSIQTTAEGKKAKKMANFPNWPNSKGKNLLINKSTLAYIADTDDDLQTIEAFQPGGMLEVGTATEIRVRLNEVGGVIVNGYWVLRVDDGTGMGVPAAAPNPTIIGFTAKHPVTPAQMVNGNELVESITNFVVEYTEPVVPESVGFNASQVQAFNASNPVIPLVFNGNSSVVPNPEVIQVPLYPNFTMTATPNGVATFTVPFNVRPINPNNLAQYVFNPLIDLAGDIDLTLTAIAASNNNNATTLPGAPGIISAATSLYDIRFDDATAAGTETFHTFGTRAFVNVPVAPQVLYFAPLSGSGVGAVNLDGQGYETNKPSTERLLILTNVIQVATCSFGSFLLGCNPNTFGDLSAMSPIGIGGNPSTLAGPTPVPGVNEGSIGSTANNGNPFAIYPAGFETVCRDSKGQTRLVSSPVVGSVSDIQVGDFLDKVFFDTLNPYNGLNLHTALSLGGIPAVGNYISNNISDPPSPNPPPMRLAVGLPPVDVVFTQQSLKQPAYVVEGDEVFSNPFPPAPYCTHPFTRLQLLPNPASPVAGDLFNTFPGNGPWYQSFTVPPMCPAGVPFSARQQVGNFLYVADRDQGVVQVLNSNTFTVIQTIETPDPEGLGLAPDLRTLYISNFGDDSLSIVDVNPYSKDYNQEVNRVKVGSGPRDVAVQPGYEDVFVSNFLGDTVSIFNPVTQSIRKTLSDSIKRPWQVQVTQRHFGTGWQSANYQAYIANQGNGDVLIYESGPSGAAGLGADGIRWGVDLPEKLTDMRNVAYDPGTYVGSVTGLPGGIYATHRDAQTGLAMITRICWTTQLPGVGSFPPVPLPSSPQNAPGIFQRRFEIVSTYGGPLAPLAQLNFGGQDQVPYDVALADFNASNFFSVIPAGGRTNNGGFVQNGVPNHKSHLRGGGATVTPDRMYVSFPGDDRIEVYSPNSSSLKLNSIENVPVVGLLAPYFDQ